MSTPTKVANANISAKADPNTLSAKQQTLQTVAPRVSSGDPVQGPKTSGIKIRGTGAATKGTMARGPMA